MHPTLMAYTAHIKEISEKAERFGVELSMSDATDGTIDLLSPQGVYWIGLTVEECKLWLQGFASAKGEKL